MTISWRALKDARAMKGWTQAELAEAVDVHAKTIVNWEAHGVPPRSEYKVKRALGKLVSYAVYIDTLPEDFSPLSYEEWLVQDNETSLDAQAQYEQRARLFGEEYAQAAAHETDEYDDIKREFEQVEYDERVAAAAARAEFLAGLSKYDSITLLQEVARRLRAAEPTGVGSGPHDEDFEVNLDDITKKDVDLAAKRGKRKVDEGHAE